MSEAEKNPFAQVSGLIEGKQPQARPVHIEQSRFAEHKSRLVRILIDLSQREKDSAKPLV